MEENNSQTILIVDDEEIITYSLSMHLSLSTNFNVITSNDPVKALKEVQNKDISLVISDYLMPGMNGIEFLTEVKKINEDITLILLTGYADKENVIKAVNQVGVYYYIEKPWDNDTLIKIISNGLEKASLIKQLKKKVEEIENSRNEINRLYHILEKDFRVQVESIENVMVSLAYILEAKDKYTVGHTQRVSEYAVKLAIKIGLDSERIEKLRMAGLIHDIGKIGVPEVILNKPGKLSEEEFELVKAHPVIGGNICKPLVNFSDLYDMIRHHHEKLNGTGYPDGLKEDEISIESRILSVADVFDALYSDRPYRSKLPLDKVIEILKEESDKRNLDPNLVECFIAMVNAKEIQV
ncbi:MAG: HD domain-containing phosphohydrolase [Deltaproteobacteria bacterium]